MLIDPVAFAQAGERLSQTVALRDLDVRLRTHEFLADDGGEFAYTLTGGRDKWDRLYLDLTVDGSIKLACQRCLKPLPFAVAEQARIVLFADEAKLEEAMLSDPDLDGVVVEGQWDVQALVEDQVLMALPFSPRHSDCDNTDLTRINQDKPNPFAVLADLPKQR